MTVLQSLFRSSEKIANLLPSLLSHSSILLKSLYEGLHSTRFAGKGENFWQYKEYTQGESVINIDWRKSASSKKILIKQREKELSKTVYLYFDRSYSMNYKSKGVNHNKFFLSALLTLTLCKLFSNNKEKVFIFNSDNKPINCSANINNFNVNFLKNKKKHTFPSINQFKDKSLCIFFSDFLFDNKDFKSFLEKCKKKEIQGYIIQILDPMEINFKLSSTTMLSDLETNETLVFDKDIDVENEYIKKIKKLEYDLRNIASYSNWKYYKFSTDKDINKFILSLSKSILIDK
ncbi:MAG: DUF58 domain-containing protein [Alphaproteobacteria bacterium TMED93]|nr:MAG: DUF58 domain-containing protein [Alphaproteobacteria bacterium TMED93]